MVKTSDNTINISADSIDAKFELKAPVYVNTLPITGNQIGDIVIYNNKFYFYSNTGWIQLADNSPIDPSGNHWTVGGNNVSVNSLLGTLNNYDISVIRNGVNKITFGGSSTLGSQTFNNQNFLVKSSATPTSNDDLTNLQFIQGNYTTNIDLSNNYLKIINHTTSNLVIDSNIVVNSPYHLRTNNDTLNNQHDVVNRTALYNYALPLTGGFMSGNLILNPGVQIGVGLTPSIGIAIDVAGTIQCSQLNLGNAQHAIYKDNPGNFIFKNSNTDFIFTCNNGITDNNVLTFDLTTVKTYNNSLTINEGVADGGLYFGNSSHGLVRNVGTNDMYLKTTSGSIYQDLGSNRYMRFHESNNDTITLITAVTGGNLLRMNNGNAAEGFTWWLRPGISGNYDLVYRNSGGADYNYFSVRASDGNIGINNTNPTSKLDVSGGEITHRGSGNYIDIKCDRSYGSSFIIKTDGQNGGRVYNLISTNNTAGVSGGKFAIFDETANAYRTILCDPSGNMGVGQGNPAYRLDVSGDINVTGSYRINGAIFSSLFAYGRIKYASGSYSIDTDYKNSNITSVSSPSAGTIYINLTGSAFSAGNYPVAQVTSSINSGVFNTVSAYDNTNHRFTVYGWYSSTITDDHSFYFSC